MVWMIEFMLLVVNLPGALPSEGLSRLEEVGCGNGGKGSFSTSEEVFGNLDDLWCLRLLCFGFS